MLILHIGAPQDIPEAIVNQDRFAWRSMGNMTWDFVVSPDHPLSKRQGPPFHGRASGIPIHLYSGHFALLSSGLYPASGKSAGTAGTQLQGRDRVPAKRIGSHHSAKPYIAEGLLVGKEVIDLHYNDGCLLAWNQENMGQGFNWVLDWLGSETWLNKVWLQYDDQAPMGYHVS